MSNCPFCGFHLPEVRSLTKCGHCTSDIYPGVNEWGGEQYFKTFEDASHSYLVRQAKIDYYDSPQFQEDWNRQQAAYQVQDRQYRLDEAWKNSWNIFIGSAIVVAPLISWLFDFTYLWTLFWVTVLGLASEWYTVLKD